MSGSEPSRALPPAAHDAPTPGEHVSAESKKTADDEASAGRTGAYLRLLAHEMANLVTPVQMAARLLKQNVDLRTAQHAGLILEETVNEMSKLIDEVRTAGQVAQQRVNVRLQRVSLASVIEQAVELARPKIDVAGHRLTVALPKLEHFIAADLNRLSQAFAQLLENAAYFTPTGGQIDLAADIAGGRAVVQVSDTGVGISPEAAEAVFELFGRDETQGNLQFDRRGIGLALVRAIVQRHGGNIQLASRTERQGTMVTVSLPVEEGCEMSVEC